MKNESSSAKQKQKAGIIGLSVVVSALLVASIVVITKLNTEGTNKTLNQLTKFRNINESEAEAQSQALLIKNDYENAVDAASRATVLSGYSCDTSGTTVNSTSSVDYICHIVTTHHTYFNNAVVMLSAKKDVPGKAEWGRVMLLLNP